MSRQHINQYRRTLAEQHRVTGSLNEGVGSKAFADLLERTGRSRELVFTPQWEGRGPRGNHIRVDGALIPKVLRIPFGYWEAKDEKDDLDREIARKRASGYPDDNIIYEDTRTAVLRQDGREVARVAMREDDDGLLALIDRFYAYERPELTEFRAAAAQFRADLPQVLDALEQAIGEAQARSADFARARAAFLAHARQAINPAVTDDDVASMLIQHILTEDIFASVFDNAQYHRENNVARRLGALEAKFFTGALRHATTERLRPYYGAIKAAAAQLADRREKQTFLKLLYEDFYKVYDPRAADRLGVVYTPGEIVRFMIRGAEWLTEKHWGKLLSDEGVEILDPATGTGTFIVELLEHMAGAGPARLAAKYANELHANEVAILPYYVANLNIEATYAAIGNGYAEFPGLVFVDTLDNTAGLGIYAGHQGDMFGGTSDENLERVKRQNAAKISVIIGNPPYNAWQSDYSKRNPNRPYQRVDDRIGQTYRTRSDAQNTNALSDMYVRFWRWAADRLRTGGVIAFITNRSFIDSIAFDGFRKTMEEEFEEGWIVDLGGNLRGSGAAAGSNVFGIKVGVAISFWVKHAKPSKRTKLHYMHLEPGLSAREKLATLSEIELGVPAFRTLRPTVPGYWLGTSDVRWDDFLPLADPDARPEDSAKPPTSIFRLMSNGVVTQRDEWMWERSRPSLTTKVKSMVGSYEAVRAGRRSVDDPGIKWDAELDKALERGVRIRFDEQKEMLSQYRPFVKSWLYFDQHLNGRRYRLPYMYRSGKLNQTITVDGMAADYFSTLATDRLFDKGLTKTGNGRSRGVSRYRYTEAGRRVDNITDWALAQFRARYPGVDVTKDRIFAYTYAALHDPVFREVHADDLRREFPRVPLHDDFPTWVGWGETLLKLHIDYEKVKPHPLTRADTPSRKRAAGTHPKPKLKSHAEQGLVVVDEDTQLSGIPAAAWQYRLGNRSAIDWVLDQHKEKIPRDPTVAAKFNTYRFADHKESMIALLAKVVTVSLATLAITDAMRAKREGDMPAC